MTDRDRSDILIQIAKVGGGLEILRAASRFKDTDYLVRTIDTLADWVAHIAEMVEGA